MPKFNIVNQYYYTIEASNETEAFEVADYIRMTEMEGMFPHDITTRLQAEGLNVTVTDYIYEQDRIDDGKLSEVAYR